MIETILSELTLNITDGKHGDCKDKENSGFYFISCKDVRGGQIHYECARQIAEEDFQDTHKRTQLEPNDILVTNSGTIGRMAFVTESPLTGRTTAAEDFGSMPQAKFFLSIYIINFKTALANL